VSSWQRNVFAVATASFVGFTGFTLVMPFLPLYLQQLGVQDVGEAAMWSGLSLGVTPAMTALLAPAWGRLSDRFGRKIMVERSLVSFILLMAGMAYATRPWHILALRAVQGLFAGYGGIALTMAAESAPRERTAYAIGTVQTAQRLGPAIGPIIGGVIAQMVGLRRAFLVTSGFYVIALLIVFVTYDERIGRPESRAHDHEPVRFRNVIAFENFILLMAVLFGLQIVDRSYGPILPLYVAELGTPLERVPLLSGLIFSIAAGAGAVGNQLCTRLLLVRTPRALISVASGLGAVGALVFLLSPRTGWLFIATPILGVALGAATTTTYTAASAVMPARARGAGFGLLTTASLTGLALSPILSGLLGATSIRAVFLLDVLVMVAIAAAVSRLMVIPTPGRPTTPGHEEI
jgi:DHA1 family multidrug resistance protein-like MFS transporter